MAKALQAAPGGGLMADGSGISLWLAFGAGILSILSPCYLALIPAYLTYLTGVPPDELPGRTSPSVMWHAICFVLGFSTLFILYGASAGMIGRFLLAHQQLLRKLAGLAVCLLGVHASGLIEIPALTRTRRLSWGQTAPRGTGKSLLIGMAFAAGWTPCVGPVLGSILLLASQAQTIAAGIQLLFAYSLGMAVPFLLMAFFIGRFRAWLPVLSRQSQAVSLVTGLLLIGTGWILYTNSFVRLARLFGS
jgi:cytochrome c-type biogenesis protein